MIDSFCKTSGGLRTLLMLKYVLKILFIVVPLIIIITSIISLAKSVTSNKTEEEMKNFVGIFVKKMVAGFLVFMIPSIISYAFTLVGDDMYELKTCLNKATLEEVNYYANVYEPAFEMVDALTYNPTTGKIDEVRNKIVSMSELRGSDKEDLIAMIDAASVKTEEYAKIIECKNKMGTWVNGECAISDRPPTSSSSSVDNSTGENGEYYYQGNGNDGTTTSYNGYKVVQTKISVSDYVRTVSSRKISQTNDTEKYNDMCLAFAYIHAYSLYSGNTSAGAEAALSYTYAGNFSTYIDTKEKILAVIYNEISNGRPVVLQVNGNKAGTSRHFVTVVGYKESVKSASDIDETDLLIIDSWDGKLETMNGKGSGTRFLTSGADCHKDYSGYRIQYLK